MLAVNLADFSSSVLDSIRIADLFFLLSTITAGGIWWVKYRKQAEVEVGTYGLLTLSGRYILLIALIALLPVVKLWSRGGFKVAYERLQDAYLHTCNVPMFTVFGSMYYDYTCDQVVYTPEIEGKINLWLEKRSGYKSLFPKVSVYDNCIFILAESLESWVLEQTVEGQELTPNLNKLLQEASTLYAPHALSQAKGGRSIDAQ